MSHHPQAPDEDPPPDTKESDTARISLAEFYELSEELSAAIADHLAYLHGNGDRKP